MGVAFLEGGVGAWMEMGSLREMTGKWKKGGILATVVRSTTSLIDGPSLVDCINGCPFVSMMRSHCVSKGAVPQSSPRRMVRQKSDVVVLIVSVLSKRFFKWKEIKSRQRSECDEGGSRDERGDCRGEL